MSAKRNISEFYSEDKSKKAIIVSHDDSYSIDLYENDKYYHTILYAGNSLRYVEDAAENYVLGIFKNVKDF